MICMAEQTPDEIVLANQGLVYAVVNRMARSGYLSRDDVPDAEQIGLMALVRIVRKPLDRPGTTIYTREVRMSILKHFGRERAKMQQLAELVRARAEADDTNGYSRHADAEALDRKLELVRTALGKLPRADADLLVRLWGLNGFRMLTHTELGNRLGITMQAVVRRERAALARLAESLGPASPPGSTP